MKACIVGAGPGDPGLLTVRAAATIREAEVLLYDALVSEPVLALASPSCERVFVGKRAGKFATAQSAIVDLMIRNVRAGRRVVRLKGGDPFIFGRGGEEAQALQAAGIAFEIVPGISSALAVPAYAGIPLTHRGVSASFTVVTGYEDASKCAAHVDWARVADPRSTLVLLMGLSQLDTIVARLIANGLPPSHPVAVVENGTLPEQRTIEATLETVVACVERARVVSPAVIVVGNVVRLRAGIAPGQRADAHALL